MQRFKNILALYDHKPGDEAALDRAVTLAKNNGAKLTVAQAIEVLPNELPLSSTSVSAVGLAGRHGFIAERQAHLERLIASIRQDGVSVSATVLQGRPFLAIIRKVIRDNHDLVIMATDGSRGFRNIAFGSTSMHLMRKCPCPVWVMQPTAPMAFRHVMAAIDPSVNEDEGNDIDLKILQLASSLARREHCHLDVVHAWDFTGADFETSRSEMTPEIRARLTERNEAAHREAVDGILAQVDLTGISVETHLVKGDPALVIPQCAVERDVDLIVMGTVGRAGIAGLFIGDTAEDVLRQVDCSVLTVKPDDFVTPVAMSDLPVGAQAPLHREEVL